MNAIKIIFAVNWILRNTEPYNKGQCTEIKKIVAWPIIQKTNGLSFVTFYSMQ